jgi:hypothetical protein
VEIAPALPPIVEILDRSPVLILHEAALLAPGAFEGVGEMGAEFRLENIWQGEYRRRRRGVEGSVKR